MRHFYLASLLLTLMPLIVQADAGIDSETAHNQLKQHYSTIKQPGLDKPNIQPDDIYPLIENIKNNNLFRIKKVGASFLKKPIYEIQVGHGPLAIFMWSQMHGDESTATASLFDLINYIKAQKNKDWVNSWQNKITIHMVPMLNPDGAEQKQRFNAQGIDINRDAKRLQTPEGRLLYSLAEKIKPEFGFNLHDQGRFYSVGKSANTATISVLAPAFNEAKDISESRHKAMQLIGLLNESIQQQYPNHVGRYDDTYSYRAFGDLLSSKGIATTLIESGHYPNDHNRQIPRWLTFMSLVQSIDIILSKSYQHESLDKYHQIPMNKSHGFVDVLLKNVSVEDDYMVDISINFDKYFQKASIVEIGDLTQKFGMKTLDMASYQLKPLKGFQVDKPLNLSTKKYTSLLQQGFGYFTGEETLINIQTTLPVIINSTKEFTRVPQRYQQPNFLFTKNGAVKLVMIKGEIIEIGKNMEEVED